jgi:hypothetical protein
LTIFGVEARSVEKALSVEKLKMAACTAAAAVRRVGVTISAKRHALRAAAATRLELVLAHRTSYF